MASLPGRRATRTTSTNFDGRSSLGLHGVLMSARACSLRLAPGLRYPDFRTLVVLCRMLGAELLGSDKRKWGATKHPVREVCAADRERPQDSAHYSQKPAPRPASDRQPTLASGIRYTFALVWSVLSPVRRAMKPETRAEPASTVPLSCPDLRIRPLGKLPTCHPRGLFHCRSWSIARVRRSRRRLPAGGGGAHSRDQPRWASERIEPATSGAASLRMSIRQPVRRAARRAF